MTRFAPFPVLLAFAASGCASTIVSAGPDAAPPRDATTPDVAPDAVPDAPPDAAPDRPAPDAAPGDVFDDAEPSLPCAAVPLASGFSLLEGMYGTGRVVFDPSRGTALLVSFSSGAVVRVASDTGALTRLAPIRYPNDVGRAAVFVDAAADALVVLPLPAAPAAPTQVLTLALARPDHWETLGILTSAAPSSPAYAVADFDVAGRSLRVAGAESYVTARRAVWDLRFTTGWGWARRADFVTPRPTEARAAAWSPARAGLVVVTSEGESGPWGLWSVGADASSPLPWTLPREGGAPVVAHDDARRVTWALATSQAGATLTAIPDDAGAVRSATVGDRGRRLYGSTGPASVAFDPAGRRLYVYVDNIAGGLPSYLTAIDVDRCLPR